MTAAATPYLSHGPLFDGVAETVFLDRFGHVTEAAHDRIADSLAAEIAKRLGMPSAPAEGATSPAAAGRN